MKKILILFIPLVFLFGCEKNTGYNCAPETGCIESSSSESGYYLNLEDCQSNCNCSCGTVVSSTYYPAFAGSLTYDGVGGFYTAGAHNAFTIASIENNCNGNIGTACVDGQGLIFGQIHCMEYSSFLVNEDGSDAFNLVNEDGMIQEILGCMDSIDHPFE